LGRKKGNSESQKNGQKSDSKTKEGTNDKFLLNINVRGPPQLKKGADGAKGRGLFQKNGEEKKESLKLPNSSET